MMKIFRFLEACFVCMLVLSSCEQYDEILTHVQGDADEVPVRFSFSIPHSIESDTEYVPMYNSTRADNDFEITLSNVYKVLIAKKMGSKWILDQVMDRQFNPDDKNNYNTCKWSAVASNCNFTLNLRPGEYQMTIITGVKALIWNDDQLKVGMVVQDMEIADNKPIYACTYSNVGNSFLNVGSRCIEEEIFSGMKYFVVEKTDDLHSPGKVEENFMSLNRTVAKLRILLKYEASSDGNLFFSSYLNGITANLKAEDGSEFCYGLDVWGKPYYDSTPITDMKYSAFAWAGTHTGEDGAEYIMGMNESSRQFCAYYFMESQVNVPVIISDVSVTANTGMPVFEYTQETPAIELKLNHITGIAFKPNNDFRIDKGIHHFGMDLITVSDDSPLDVSGLFSNNYEYKK